MKMAKMGKTPTLVCGSAGQCEFVTAKRKRTCKRCDSNIVKDEDCVVVKNPVGNPKPYCLDCFQEVLDQSQKDLDKLKEKLAKLKK